MSNFKPSIYQQAIFDFIENGTGNAVINAVAGSGKTTTIVKALELIPADASIYFLAFGKAIAEEIKSRVPSYVNVSTLHSLGAKALYAARKSQMDDKRVYNVVSSLRDSWYNEDPELVDADYLARVRKLVDLYRLNLIENPTEAHTMAVKHGIEVVNGELTKAMEVLHVLDVDKTTHDFVDMLYMAATEKEIKLPKADWVFVDECQDLNKAQQAMIRKMIHSGTRLIFVGDPHQAIYGFAGADSESFETLKRFPNTIELPLSFNYRCGSKIIAYVNELLPSIDIKAHDGAIEGEVEQNDTIKNIKDGDMVLCRNTAPLVKLCMHFIKMHFKAYIKGGDMGKQLATLVIRSKANTIEQFEQWLEKELRIIFSRIAKKSPKMTTNEIKEEPAYMVMQEKIEVFQAIVDSADVRTPQQLITWINELFSDNKRGICFSTAHKAKGLEADRVFVIDRELMPAPYARKEWQIVQEYNLLYVVLTRAKHYLGFIEDWHYKKK